MFDGSTTYEFLETPFGSEPISEARKYTFWKANSSAAMNMNEKSVLIP